MEQQVYDSTLVGQIEELRHTVKQMHDVLYGQSLFQQDKVPVGVRAAWINAALLDVRSIVSVLAYGIWVIAIVVIVHVWRHW